MRSTAAKPGPSSPPPATRSARALASALAGLLLLAFAGGCGDDDGESSAASATEGDTDAATDSDAMTDTDSATDSDSATDTDAGSTSDTDSVDEGPWDSLEERPCPGDSFLTYENFGGPFINNNCTGCHHSSLSAGERQNAPPGFDFETVELIRKHADRIWARSGDDNATMPPAGPPAEDERALLGEWLACGAPTADDLMD